jgi:hypothetical protein
MRVVLNSILTAAILHDEEEEAVLDEKKAIFYAAAELEVRYFFFEARNIYKLTDHDLGRAGPTRLASCIVQVSPQTRYHQSTG